MILKYNKNWRNKPHPYWFARRYPHNGGWTIQVMGLEIWNRLG